MPIPSPIALALLLVALAAAVPEHPPDVPPPVAFWMPNDFTNSVLGFADNANGDVPPSRILAGDRTGLAGPSAVAVDLRGMLYVANAGNNSVTIYPPGADGNTAPFRTLRGPSTGLANPRGIAVDTAGAIYVANKAHQRVTVYPPGADGDLWPVRSIWGSRTGLADVYGIAVDRQGAVYVASLSTFHIDVFAPGADGNVRPASAITGRGQNRQGVPARDRTAGLTQPLSLALGRDERLYVTTYDHTVMVFRRGARGFARPERTIAGRRTGLYVPTDIVVDRRGGIAVRNWGLRRTVTVFDPGARGNARPVRTIAGPATGLMLPDTVRDRPHVPPAKLAPSVTVYAPGASGDTPPSRRIAGARTLLATPMSTTLGRDTTLYVLSCQGRLTAYAPGADGDRPPTRVLGRGLSPALAFGVALDGEDTVYVSHNGPGRGGHGYLFVYPPGSSSDTTPVRIIQGFRLGLNELARDAHGLLYRGDDHEGFDVVDPRAAGERPPIRRLAGSDGELFRPGSFAIDSGGRLYVPTRDDAVRVYDGRAPGELRPMRTISGRLTGLDQPVAVALGPGDTLFVANSGTARGPSVTVYPPGAAGDAAPARMLRGARTGLTSLGALAVDVTGTLYAVNNPEGTHGCWPERW